MIKHPKCQCSNKIYFFEISFGIHQGDSINSVILKKKHSSYLQLLKWMSDLLRYSQQQTIAKIIT